MLNLLNNIPLRHCKTAQTSFRFTRLNKLYIKSSIIQYNVTFTKALHIMTLQEPHQESLPAANEDRLSHVL